MTPIDSPLVVFYWLSVDSEHLPRVVLNYFSLLRTFVHPSARSQIYDKDNHTAYCIHHMVPKTVPRVHIGYTRITDSMLCSFIKTLI